MKRTLFIITVLFSSGFLMHTTSFADLFDSSYRYSSNEDYDEVVVAEVIDPETILLADGQRLKLLGIKSPLSRYKKSRQVERDEYGFVIEPPVDPATPLEERAVDFTKELLEGKKVRIEFDYNKRNDDGAKAGYVFLLDSGKLANAEIVRYGFAELKIRPPNVKYADELREAYQEARKERRGLQGQ